MKRRVTDGPEESVVLLLVSHIINVYLYSVPGSTALV